MEFCRFLEAEHGAFFVSWNGVPFFVGGAQIVERTPVFSERCFRQPLYAFFEIDDERAQIETPCFIHRKDVAGNGSLEDTREAFIHDIPHFLIIGPVHEGNAAECAAFLVTFLEPFDRFPFVGFDVAVAFAKTAADEVHGSWRPHLRFFLKFYDRFVDFSLHK